MAYSDLGDMMRALLAVLACTSPAFAQCPDGAETFLSCRIEGSDKRLQVCLVGQTLTYRFGPPGAPELALAAPVTAAGYTPWPGIGRTIYEEVTFRSGDFRYVVFGGIERDHDATTEEIIPTRFGGVSVFLGADESPLAAFSCARDTVDFPWSAAIGDAKRGMGLTFDRQVQRWVPDAE